jgi:hypothetical protein
MKPIGLPFIKKARRNKLLGLFTEKAWGGSQQFIYVRLFIHMRPCIQLQQVWSLGQEYRLLYNECTCSDEVFLDFGLGRRGSSSLRIVCVRHVTGMVRIT